MKTFLAVTVALVTSLSWTASPAATETFSVIFGGKTVGHLKASSTGNETQIDFDYKNNGRGPTIAET
ncbi:MAG TPA: hypothetical protein VIT67_02615, partial [Povalibacter sp.]